MLSKLRAIDFYHIDHRILTTCEHGLPQHRRRVYLVGWSKATGASTLHWPEAIGHVSLVAILDNHPDDYSDVNFQALSALSRSKARGGCGAPSGYRDEGGGRACHRY